MTHSPSIFIGTPLPAAAAELLAEHGFLPPVQPTAPAAPAAGAPPPTDLQPLSAVQAQIWAALTGRPLNDRQVTLLEIYWRARQANEPALSVEEAARRLATAFGIQHKLAADYVKGALRSFGRRLLQTLERPPAKTGHDIRGEGVADEIPLLALMSIETGPFGESRHRLTDDGVVAVAAALGLNAHRIAAGAVPTGDPALDDLDAVVMIGMTRLAATQLLRVQKSMGLSMDATIKALTAQAGAG
jgi:hypothetical protein